ncbi:MAG: hypothetical protein ABW321_13880, partial [Polyangiales bacterium]
MTRFFASHPLFARWLRLGALFLVLAVGSTCWLLHRASANASERALAAGRQLEQFRDLANGMSTLRVNGQRVTLSSMSSEQSVGDVLDRFGALCSRDSGGIDAELQQLVAAGKRLPSGLDPKRFGILRSEPSAREGVSACFAREGSAGLSDFAARLMRTVETGDFGEMGQLRYVFARRREGATSTHVITVWSQGAIPLAEMFPATGDAPGRDLFDGARPAGSRRVVAAELEGSDHQVAIYETQHVAEAALAGFAGPLLAHGFEAGDLSQVETINAIPTRVYLRPDATVLLLADERADGTTVSAFRLHNGGYVS